jgi:hypothetical protein
MGSPKTVDRNAMTFVPIGWNVVPSGVKTRLELGQGIGDDSETQQVSEPNAGKRHKIQNGLQNSRSQMEAAKARGRQKRGAS